MGISAHKFAHCLPPVPTRHKRKVPFHPAIVAPPKLNERMLEIFRLDQELDRVVLREQDYLELIADAYASNFHYSTKLEGNQLPLEEVKRLTRNSFEGTPTQAKDNQRQEILNHMLVAMEPTAWHTPWGTPEIRGIHRLLMEGVDETARPGEYRDFDSAIIDGEGDENFITAPPRHVPEEMEELVKWVNVHASTFYPVVAAAIFFHEFESIHPFADGNGRTGRVLFHGYLSNHGLPNAHLCMMEQELTASPDLYYRILGWTDYTGQYTELIDFFTDAILTSYRKAVRRFSEKDLLSTGLDETAKRLVAQAKRHGDWFSIADASRWVDGRAEDTVRRHLNSLVEMTALESAGATRSKRYRYPNPFAKARQAMKASAADSQSQASS